MTPYFEEEGQTIYLGDCRDILQSLCGVGFDAFITDPQYGIGEAYDSGRDNQDDVDCGLWALTYLRGTAKHGALTPGVKNLYTYPKPEWVGSFFYPAATGLGPWGFVCWQPILFYGADPYLSSGGGSRPDSMISTEVSEKNGHPCPKPIGQWKWLIQRATLEGETVCDPFMGSGTTLRACKDLGRRGIGIEINERYAEIAANRLRQKVFSF